ncbi:MAG: hypothetical protein C4312_04495 [Thermoflexus sp.]
MGRRKGVLWILMGIAVALAFVLSPSLQRVAHAVLQGFRFRRVLVVPYTFAMPQASLENLRRILGGDLAVEGADPRLVQTPEEAETLLGFRIRRLPGVEAFATLQVIPVTTVRWTVRLDHLREALHAVGADDVALPETLDGTAMTLTGGPVLLATLEHQGTPLGFLQAPLPALTMSPEGDVRPLAEATLRLMGMPAAEARRLANTVDWQTTLLSHWRRGWLWKCSRPPWAAAGRARCSLSPPRRRPRGSWSPFASSCGTMPNSFTAWAAPRWTRIASSPGPAACADPNRCPAGG